MGLLVAVVVVTANTSDNAGGIATVEIARGKSERLKKGIMSDGAKPAPQSIPQDLLAPNLLLSGANMTPCSNKFGHLPNNPSTTCGFRIG